uniref:Uncharacterized protein MANES_15G191800 n=1 Tax=Rhizophora mucronata TaxID=61149 RepID=A0A2P2MFL6_RHIMU
MEECVSRSGEFEAFISHDLRHRCRRNRLLFRLRVLRRLLRQVLLFLLLLPRHLLALLTSCFLAF